jgi:hypothetical protein
MTVGVKQNERGDGKMVLWYFLTEKIPNLPSQKAITGLFSSRAYPA